MCTCRVTSEFPSPQDVLIRNILVWDEGCSNSTAILPNSSAGAAPVLVMMGGDSSKSLLSVFYLAIVGSGILSILRQELLTITL
jgi:hypothetical protein